MIGFWVAAGLFTALALWFVARPLLVRRNHRGAPRNDVNIELYREQSHELDADLANELITPEQRETAQLELEARVLEDVAGEDTAIAPRPARRMAIALAAIAPVGALAIYLLVGAPAALDPQVLARNPAGDVIDNRELEALVEKLAARLRENPENGEAWVMLAKSYRHFERFKESAQAYANAVSRLPADATLFADYADVLGMAQGRRLQGEPEKLIARALELDPSHFKALALAGSVAYEKKDYASAAQYWERMLPLVPPDSEPARTIQANIAEARGLAGTGAAAAPAVGAAAAPAAGAAVRSAPAPAISQGGVSGVVSLAPEIAAKVAPTDTVFIYARAPEGPRMPLAIVRKQARELPVQFTLDDTTAMGAGMTISKQQHVVITARVSKSSSATPQPGDLEGRVGPVRNDATGVTVVIDREIR